jgi:hypothetical protein
VAANMRDELVCSLQAWLFAAVVVMMDVQISVVW